MTKQERSSVPRDSLYLSHNTQSTLLHERRNERAAQLNQPDRNYKTRQIFSLNSTLVGLIALFSHLPGASILGKDLIALAEEQQEMIEERRAAVIIEMT